MSKFLSTLILTFFISLGVILGGSILGALGAMIGNRPPMNTMVELAGKMKIWALVTALGGSFSIIEAFETGLIGGHPGQLLQQFVFLISAFAGAHLGYLIIINLAGGR
ncbi:MAG: YtrH family sporulation protein [Dethiobacteria bacterium]